MKKFDYHKSHTHYQYEKSLHFDHKNNKQVLRATEVWREGVRNGEAAGEAYTTDLVKAMAAWQTHTAAECSSGGVLER